MMPVTNTSNIYTPPPTLVGATIPGNNTLRVSADNVPPPVSNVEINNNQKGSGSAITFASAPSSANLLASSATFTLSPFIYTTPTSLSAGAQNIFLTHLLSQDASPEASSVLTQYEEMVAIAEVKYKPSNATLPEPEPANLFGRILQQERQIQSVQKIVQQAAQQATATQAFSSVANSATVLKPVTISREAPLRASSAKITLGTSLLRQTGVQAYMAVVARNTLAAKKSSNELPVEAITPNT